MITGGTPIKKKDHIRVRLGPIGLVHGWRVRNSLFTPWDLIEYKWTCLKIC